MIRFQDLLFDNEIITLQENEIKTIEHNPKANTFIIENIDGLFFECVNYEKLDWSMEVLKNEK